MPRVSEIMHVAVKSAFTNICEKMGRSKELTSAVLQYDTTASESSWLLDIQQSTVSGMIGNESF